MLKKTALFLRVGFPNVNQASLIVKKIFRISFVRISKTNPDQKVVWPTTSSIISKALRSSVKKSPAVPVCPSINHLGWMYVPLCRLGIILFIIITNILLHILLPLFITISIKQSTIWALCHIIHSRQIMDTVGTHMALIQYSQLISPGVFSQTKFNQGVTNVQESFSPLH